MRRAIVYSLMLALILGALTAMACGGKKEQAPSGEATEEAAGTTEETGGSKEVTAKSGRGWSDIPEYKGASKSRQEGEVSLPAAARGEYERAETRWYETDDSWEQVHEYYLERMPREGWTKMMAMKYPEGSGISVWRKDDGDRGCVVTTAVRRDGMTHVGLVLNEGKK